MKTTVPGLIEKPALQRTLNNRHIQLMAMGGAIGTGLFMGSGKIIALSGTSIILIYMIIGLFVFFGATAEARMVLTTSMLQGHRVKDIIRTKFTTLSPHDTVEDVQRELLAGADQDFVVLDNETVVGVLKRSQLMEALTQRKDLWRRYIEMFTSVKEAPSDDAYALKFEVSLDLRILCRYGRSISDLTTY
jgi:hypothetical protein